VQVNTDDTVEAKLFEALKKCCLIDADPDSKLSSCVYTRCGRTDKGVSALANVCTLFVRHLPAGDYCMRINHCLPPDIRVLAYAEVPPQFDSRFSCIYREYKYFFFKTCDVDIGKIQKAAKLLVGIHDFRNFCKKDDAVAGPEGDEDQNFMRRIYQFRIVKVSSADNCFNSAEQIDNDSANKDVYMAIIKGSAFLWHQVRCMMAVLFMIGRGIEKEEVIGELLDVEKIQERPNYDIADGANLILSECGFEGVQWKNYNLFADLETFNTIK